MTFDESMIPFLAALLASGAVLLVAQALRGMFGNRQRVQRMHGRLTRHAAGVRAVAAAAPALPESPLSALKAALNAMAERVGQKVVKDDGEEVNEAGLALVRAGYRNRRAPLAFWGVKAGLTLCGLVLGLIVRLLAGNDIPLGMVALLFICPAVVGLYAPNVWLSRRIKARRLDIINSLPDALDLLVVCVEAGMGLDQAFSRVAREMAATNPVLADELNLVILELRAGKSRAEALKNLAARVALEDVNSLVTLIVQADAFGTSISSTLRVYSDTMRTTRFQRAEEIAAKMPVKLLFPLVFCILPALFVTIMGPAFITLMRVFAQIGQ